MKRKLTSLTNEELREEKEYREEQLAELKKRSLPFVTASITGWKLKPHIKELSPNQIHVWKAIQSILQRVSDLEMEQALREHK